jgi:hypothetical protein
MAMTEEEKRMLRRAQDAISMQRVRYNRLRATESQPFNPDEQAAANAMLNSAIRSQLIRDEADKAERQRRIDLGMGRGMVVGDVSFGRSNDADWINMQAEEIKKQYGTQLPSGWAPYTGEYRGGGALFPTAPAEPDKAFNLPPLPPTVADYVQYTPGAYVAPTYTAPQITNPYVGLQAGLSAMTENLASQYSNEVQALEERYSALRSAIMSQFGDTDNQSLLNARDLALAELDRQAQDAAQQVAANYQAAQGRQAELSARQVALGQELGAQNATMANVAAGNIAAWNEQFGTGSSQAGNIGSAIAASAPRAQALAQALGLSAGQFESAMGTSLAAQQQAIQGQIARDLAARQGQVSVQTAREIAAAERANAEARRQAAISLALQQFEGLEAARGRQSEREFALQQSLLQAGLQAGQFYVEQARLNQAEARAAENEAFNRYLANEKLAMERVGMTNQQINQRLAAEQNAFDNAMRQQEANFNRALALDEATRKDRELAILEARAASEIMPGQQYVVPQSGQSLVSGYLSASSNDPMATAIANSMEQLASVASGGLTTENEVGAATLLWRELIADKNALAYLNSNGIKTLDSFINYINRQPSTAGAQAYYGSRPPAPSARSAAASSYYAGR